MTYKALYRKYRPTRFEDVVGQDYIIKTLRQTIKQNKVGHAYLFVVQEEQVKQVLQNYLRKQLIV